MYPMLPVSLDCRFLIVPSVFSKVYFIYGRLSNTVMYIEMAFLSSFCHQLVTMTTRIQFLIENHEVLENTLCLKHQIWYDVNIQKSNNTITQNKYNINLYVLSIYMLSIILYRGARQSTSIPFHSSVCSYTIFSKILQKTKHTHTQIKTSRLLYFNYLNLQNTLM